MQPVLFKVPVLCQPVCFERLVMKLGHAEGAAPAPSTCHLAGFSM